MATATSNRGLVNLDHSFGAYSVNLDPLTEPEQALLDPGFEGQVWTGVLAQNIGHWAVAA